MKRLIPIITVVCMFLFFGCDEAREKKLIVKDFYLWWWSDNREQEVIRGEGKFFETVVPKTVFAVGFNDDFIIAKRHPNKIEEIGDRLFSNGSPGGDYQIDPADTIYLHKDDRYYQKYGKWYHISNGWDPPDSLNPYRKETIYHIIDTRKCKGDTGRYTEYEFLNKPAFDSMRTVLGVPETVGFTIINKDLE